MMNWQRLFVLVSLLLSLVGCTEQPRGPQHTLQTPKGSPPMVKIRYRQYEDRVDLTGKNIITISGASRGTAKELFPFLAEPSGMEEREFTTKQATAYNGEVADEVHEFNNATQGRTKIMRLLLRDGEVIELTVGPGKM